MVHVLYISWNNSLSKPYSILISICWLSEMSILVQTLHCAWILSVWFALDWLWKNRYSLWQQNTKKYQEIPEIPSTSLLTLFLWNIFCNKWSCGESKLQTVTCTRKENKLRNFGWNQTKSKKIRISTFWTFLELKCYLHSVQS